MSKWRGAVATTVRAFPIQRQSAHGDILAFAECEHSTDAAQDQLGASPFDHQPLHVGDRQESIPSLGVPVGSQVITTGGDDNA